MELTVSVVIPVHNAAGHLRRCLESLHCSLTPPAECIVVDDGSSDGSAAVAQEYGAVVVSCRQSGPARARNLGAAAARGSVLFFMDADVCVHEDTLDRIVSDMAADPGLDAVIGCYDESPDCPGVISQYRNLRQCFVHQRACAKAFTFWTGCGAIRRSVFLSYGGFDEEYARPSIEDIELGYRLANANRNIVLDRTVLVKHLKRWTLWSLLKTDILDRGIPWTELILRDHRMPNDLNLQVRERLAVVLAFLLLALIAAGTVRYGRLFPLPYIAVPLLAMAGCRLMKRPRNGPPASVLHLLSTIVLQLLISGPGGLALVTSGVLAALVATDREFYRFVQDRRGVMCALAVVHFQMLYHFYSGISFCAGLGCFAWRALLPHPPHPGPCQVPVRGATEK